jgi:hypothetical protein
MTQRGIAAALLTVGITLAGCSGSSSSEPTPPDISPTTTDVPSTSAPALLSLADACPKVQDALDANFADEIFPPPLRYRQFAQDIDDIIEQTDPKGRNILDTLARTSEQVASDIEDAGDSVEKFLVRDPWFAAMDRVGQVCEDQGAPLK